MKTNQRYFADSSMSLAIMTSPPRLRDRVLAIRDHAPHARVDLLALLALGPLVRVLRFVEIRVARARRRRRAAAAARHRRLEATLGVDEERRARDHALARLDAGGDRDLCAVLFPEHDEARRVVGRAVVDEH